MPPSPSLMPVHHKLSAAQPTNSLALRRLPLVVIPRKRKYKNYVSRRRNTQLLASLRRCVSDPNMYKSYNHWKGLSRPMTPVKSGAPTPKTVTPLPIPPVPGHQNLTPNPPPTQNPVKLPSPHAVSEKPHPATPLSKTSKDPTPPNQSINKQVSGKLTELKSKNVPNMEKTEKTVLRIPSAVSSRVKAATSSAAATTSAPQPAPITQPVQQEEPVKKGEKEPVKASPFAPAIAPLRDGPAPPIKPPVVKQNSLQKPPEPKRSIGGMPPAKPIFPPSTAKVPSSPESVRKIDGIEFLSKDQDDGQLPTTSAGPKALRRAYGSKSGTTICAIGSPNVPSTSNAPPPADDDKRLIEKKLSLRKKKMGEAANPGGILTGSKSGIDIGSSNLTSKNLNLNNNNKEQTDEQRAKKTVNAVAAAFSTLQGPSAEDSGPLKDDRPPSGPPKPKNPAVQSLISQLQLPASVSARVDKIIACGDKARKPSRAGLQVLLANSLCVLNPANIL